jgi:hypothetical protein
MKRTYARERLMCIDLRRKQQNRVEYKQATSYPEGSVVSKEKIRTKIATEE